MAHSAPSSLPYARDVRVVASEEPFYWLARGWRDFTVAPRASLGYGAIFVAIAFLLTYNLWRTDKYWLLAPLGSALVMLIPLVCIGFHGISRAIEQHRRPSFFDSFFAWQDNFESMAQAALVFLFIVLSWLSFTSLAFALTFPPALVLNAHGLGAYLLSGAGMEFLGLSAALGLVLAVPTFMGGAFALPMMLHRDVGMAEAVAASFTATLVNWRAVAVWAGIVIALTIAGLAFCLVGLAVTLPLVGHASWHAYRAMVAVT